MMIENVAVGDLGLGEERIGTGITGGEEASFQGQALPGVISGFTCADNQSASCAGAFGARPRHGLRILLAGLAASVVVGAGPIADAIDAFHAAAKGAEASVVASAKALFVLLAVIGGCWDVISLMFDRADIATWASAFLRRVMLVPDILGCASIWPDLGDRDCQESARRRWRCGWGRVLEPGRYSQDRVGRLGNVNPRRSAFWFFER